MGKSKLEELKDHEFYKPIYNQLLNMYNGDIPKEIGDYFVELSQRSNNKIANTNTWVNRTYNIILEILSGTAHDAVFPMFWIHLYEIVFQFYEDENKHRKINELIEFKRPIIACLDSIREEFSEEELILLKFCRHSSAHMYLNSIWSRPIVKHGKVIRINSAKLPEAMAIAEKYIQECGGSQKLLAMKYAENLKDKIFALKEANDNAI